MLRILRWKLSMVTAFIDRKRVSVNKFVKWLNTYIRNVDNNKVTL
jgi:hypothetical protein